MLQILGFAELCSTVKAKSHSIRFSSAFVRFFFSIKKLRSSSFAVLYFHIRIFVKGYSLILKYRSHCSYTKFLSICKNLLSADMDLQKMRTKKSIYFSIEKQKRKKITDEKQTKNGCCVNLPQGKSFALHT